MIIHSLLNQGLIPYVTMDQIQRGAHTRVAAGTAESCLLIWEAEPTYTAGRHAKPEDIVDDSLPVVETDRAGSVTWHGPGQLVIYPIVKLTEPVDLIKFIRAVEGAVLDTVRESWGIDAELIPGRAGVWTKDPIKGERKIAAIGLKVSKATSLHGVSLNINPDFTQAFGGIIPCGLSNAGVCSLEEYGVQTTPAQAAQLLQQAMVNRLTPLLDREVDREPRDFSAPSGLEDLFAEMGMTATESSRIATQKELNVNPA